MASGKTYDRESIRQAKKLWTFVSVVMVAALIVPYWWFWGKISSNPITLVLITGSLVWALWSWWRFASGVTKRIASRPELQRDSGD